jgi:hypothetical protein
MATQERIPLFDAKVELARHLTADERNELGNLSLPVVTIAPGPLDLPALLARDNAFGATVLDGIVMNALQVGEQTGIQLLGPGDLLVHGSDLLPDWLGQSVFQTTGSVRLGLFGNELLAAAYRWPRIIEGLYTCVGDQLQRMSAQLIICQLPRVDERVLAMLWLLAESWGQVTPGGVRLPLALTHETIGALVGARRPTITLALRKLTEDGALVHQDSGWLLLHPPPQPADPASKILPPDRVVAVESLWAQEPAQAKGVNRAALWEVVRELRAQHRSDREQTREQLRRIQVARTRMLEVRQRIEDDALNRRWPPSS